MQVADALVEAWTVVTYKHVVLGPVFFKWVLRWNQSWSDAAS